MALPVFDETFAEALSLPKKLQLARWLVAVSGTGTVDDYYTLPERYLYAKIAVAYGCSRPEADYISLPNEYVLGDIYAAINGTPLFNSKKEGLGKVVAAIRGDEGNEELVAYYINLPEKYQLALAATSAGPSIDIDVKNFITASGATDVAAIEAFVLGIKELNLWNSMVCWPLRSTQNAGTGTTVYSLGGLGTFNGTLVGGPTWGASGISFDGTNDYMNSPLNANNYLSEFSELAVFNAASTTRSFSTFFGDESFASGGRLAMIRRPSTNNQAQIVTDLNVSPAISTQNMTFNQFNSVHARFLIPRNFISINSSSETSSLGSGTVINAGANDDNVGFAARNKNIGGQVFATMTAAFGAFWSNATSASQMQSVKTLYKQTLGAGLSLP